MGMAAIVRIIATRHCCDNDSGNIVKRFIWMLVASNNYNALKGIGVTGKTTFLFRDRLSLPKKKKCKIGTVNKLGPGITGKGLAC